MPIIINPDGLTARFDTSERIRLAERWNREASVNAQTVSHNGAQVVALNCGLGENAVADTGLNHLNQAQGRIHRPGRPWPFDYGSSVSASETGRMSGGPAPEMHNFPRGPVRGRTADRVIVDDLEDMRMMGLTTRTHDEVRVEIRPSPSRRDDLIDAALYAWENAHPHFRVTPNSASHALVTVSAPRQAQVERFSKVALEEIDRPVYHDLLAARARMRTIWEELMTKKAHDLRRKNKINGFPYLVQEARWVNLPQHRLLDEMGRHINMLLEDGYCFADICIFALGTPLVERTISEVSGILLCHGVGVKEYVFIDAAPFGASA